MQDTNKSITILFAGDFIPHQPNTQLYSNNLLEVLQNKDFSIVNLEAPFTNSKKSISKTGLNFGIIPENVLAINQGYFNALALSNNHIRDFGDEGIETTLSICKSNGISIVGAGANIKEAEKPLVVDIKGKKICFLNYSEHEFNIASSTRAGANPFDIINAHNNIKEQKANCDYVFVIYHGGLENHKLPPVSLVKRLKFLVDIGADAVVVHHSHNYSGLIIHNSKPILFGLGNFLLKVDSRKPEAWYNGLLLKLILTNDEIGVELIPIVQNKDFTKVSLVEGEEKQRIIDELITLSSIIEDTEQLEKYWENKNQKFTFQLLNLLKSKSRIEYRLRKKLGFVRKKLSAYRLNTLLNLTRCESHRERMIQVLENMYNKNQDLKNKE